MKQEMTGKAHRFALGKENFIIIAVSIAVIIVGFLLMSGGQSTEEAFDPGIFSKRRIVIAPLITVAGFLMVIWGILKKPKH